MLNRVIYGDDILAQAKSLAIKALYIKWKTLSQLKRLTLTDFLEGDEKVARQLHRHARHRRRLRGRSITGPSTARRSATTFRAS